MAQDAISKAELKTYLKRVRQRIAKNPDSPAWGQLEARWLAVVEHAKGIVAEFQSGKPGIRYVRKAAEEVLKVAEAATPRDVIETVMADSRREKLTSCRVLDIVIDGLSDIVGGRFDAGIRIGERLEKDMIAGRPAADIKMIAVASPQ